MSTNPNVYEELNKAWKSTCKVIFREEVGELKDFEEWLSEYVWLSEHVGKPKIERSYLSGKEVYLAGSAYCKDARFIGFDEIDFNKRFEPLNINEIKDIDSIVEAVHERMSYAGNIVLGNSKFVEGSSNITNSFYIYKSFRLHDAEYVAYGKAGKGGKHLFGGTGGQCDYMVKGIVGTNCQRCFEYWSIFDSSDMYYSADASGCSDCMFCFNVKGKRRSIGNLELPQEKYSELKKKILSEIVDDLKRKKRAPSLLELVSQFPRKTLELKTRETELFDISPIEAAFQDTFKLIFKIQSESNLDSYGDFLLKYVPRTFALDKTSSQAGQIILSTLYRGLPVPESRVISIEESAALSGNPPSLTQEEVGRLSLSDSSPLSKIAYVALDFNEGHNKNISKTTIVVNSADCYNGDCYAYSKLSAYSFWPRHSSHMFGSSMTLTSAFCINAYQSERLARAFEVDTCNSCSDIYYSHNCENVHDSMFCFNVKNLNRAIGNSPLAPEQYNKIKNQIIGQLADELVKKKDLKWDIFNIGCFGIRQD